VAFWEAQVLNLDGWDERLKLGDLLAPEGGYLEGREASCARAAAVGCDYDLHGVARVHVKEDRAEAADGFVVGVGGDYQDAAAAGWFEGACLWELLASDLQGALAGEEQRQRALFD
jgi:hypothetical protein